MSYAFRGIDMNNDWLFGQGRQSYFRENDAIMADIRTALLMVVGDFFAAADAGVDWWNLTGGMNPTAKNEVIRQCRVAIAGIAGVVRINSVDAAFSPTTRKLTVTYDVATVFTQSIQGTLTKT